MSNKIIIIGHPRSNYQQVEKLLLACGMEKPLPSRREKLKVQEITAILTKHYKARTINHITSSRDVKQLRVAKIWESMALDLMLGNIEQELWGWSDPNAIHLLSYWRDLDPDINFVLVYDHPKTLLANLTLEQASDLTTESMHTYLQNWEAYNTVLLNFYQRNKERCLLVHSQQVRDNATAYLQQVQERLTDAPWSDKMLAVINNSKDTYSESFDAVEVYNELVIVNDNDPKANDNVNVIGSHNTSDSCVNPLLTFLIDTIIQGHDSLAFYEKLQQTANLPSVLDEVTIDPWQAWQGMVSQQQQLYVQQQEIEEKKHKVIQIKQLITQTETQLADKQKQLADLQTAQQALQQAKQSNEQENQLLITQLHQVQEELEKYYLQNQQHQNQLNDAKQQLANSQKVAQERQAQLERSSKELAALGQAKQQIEKTVSEREQQHEKQLNDAKKQLANSQRVMQERQVQLDKIVDEKKRQAEQGKQQLTKLQTEMQAVQAKANNPELKTENELLITQLHQVQEELERYYLENQRLKSGTSASKLKKTVYYGAAERVKNDLPYRLGAIMVKSKTPKEIVQLPVALVKEYKDFQHHKPNENLPSVEEYQDAYEANKVKKHLSYKLGKTLVDSVKSPKKLLDLPVSMGKEIYQFSKKR